MKPAIVTMRTFMWNATFRRPLSLLIFVISAILIWLMFIRVREHVLPVADQDVDWEAEYEKMRLNGLKEHLGFYVTDPKHLKPVPFAWTAKEKCPACFGTDMCDALKHGEILIDIPAVETSANKKGVFFGRWNDIPVAIKRLSNGYPKEFESFDKFICSNTTGSEKCNVSKAIVAENSYVQGEAVFEPEHMHQLWKISYAEDGPLSLEYTMCITPRVVKTFNDLYAIGGHLSREDKAMLFTSMVVQPESLMLKFLKGIQFQRLAPRAYGACGRLIVVEHGGHLLTSYLDASFSERAELAMQLISLVQVLWHADRRWFALYRDFDYENFAVTHEKEIYIIDYEELNIIENVDFDESVDEDRHDEHFYGHNITCNDDCFNNLLNQLASNSLPAGERRTHCQSLHSVAGSLMYSALCRNILSDDAKHRAAAGKSGSNYRGLLHSVPAFERTDNMQQRIKDALHECVHETKPGGRVEAINEMSDILALYLKIV